MEKCSPTNVLRKFSAILLMFLVFRLTLCQENKVKVGIIYDVSTEISPNIIEEHTSSCYFCSSPTQMSWLSLSASGPSAMRKVWALIGSGVHVVISTLRCPQLTSLTTITEALRIPHLALDIDSCRFRRNETYTIHLVNQFYYLPELIAKIADQERWNKLILILNHIFVRGYKKHFVEELSKAGLESVLWNGGDVKSSTESHKLIFIPTKNNNIQLMLNSTEYIPSVSSWIIVTGGDVADVELAQIRTFLPKDSMLIRPKCQCSHAETGNLCNKTALQRQIFAIKRLIVKSLLVTGTNESTASNTTQTTEGQSFFLEPDQLFNTLIQKLYHVRESETQVRYGINDDCVGDFEILKPSVENNTIEVVGEWSPTKGLLNYEVNSGSSKIDFGGIILRVGALGDIAPFSYASIGKNGTYHGLMIDILDQVAMDLNFRYVWVEPPDGFFGHQLDSGIWTGIIGMIHRKDIVLGVGSFSVNMERSEAVDFTIPFMETSVSILTSIQDKHTDIFQFVKTFPPNVWLLILMFGITTSITLFGIIRLTEQNSAANAHRSSSIKDIVFDVLAAFLEQGFPSYPNSMSARCLLAFWFFFSLLIVSIYTAHLTAVLTVSTPIKNIDSLKDLNERSDLDIIVHDGSSLWMLFQLSKEPLHQRIYKRLLASITIEDTVQKVMSGKACFISDTLYLQYIVALTCGKVRIAEEKFQHQFYGFPIQKISPFKKPIDNSLQITLEAGLIERFTKKWLDQPRNCVNGPPGDDTDYAYGMVRLGGVFLMFTGFVALAVLACVVEHTLLHAITQLISVCLNLSFR